MANSSSLDYINNIDKSMLERLKPKSNTRQRRIQNLVIEVEDMEKSFSVLDFGTYFNKVIELKNLLLAEITDVSAKLRKQDVELERLRVVVEEKNRAISTLADESVTDKEAFRSAQQELKIVKARVAEMEDVERQYRALTSSLQKTDSAWIGEIVHSDCKRSTEDADSSDSLQS